MKLLLQIIFLILIKASFGQESKIIHTQDGDIHYMAIGKDKSILIINGGPGFNSEGFANIGKEIASLGYKVVLYDQRGTGKSTLKKIDSTTVTIDLMAKDIEVIRKDIGVENWILFGHSFGGMLANYYTTKFPDKVSAIIHSSSGGMDLHLIENAQENLYARLTEQEIDSLRFWRNQLSDNNTEFNRRKFYQYLASAYLYNKEHVHIVSQRLMQGDMNLNRMVWNNMISTNFDCKEALKSYNKPVLILQGKQDIIPPALALTADTVFSNSSLYFLEHCGHYGWLDQKEEYLSLIKTFLLKLEED